MTTITSAQDYKEYLHNTFPGDPIFDGRFPRCTEGINGTFQFLKGLDNIGFTHSTYNQAAWNVMHSQAPNGLVPSVAELDVLRFYTANKRGWYTPEVARDYGREFFAQLPAVRALLAQDPRSRQAVIRMTGDKCLLSVQFLLRSMDNGQNVLVTLANFRSCDAIHGLPADLYVLQRLTDEVIGSSAVTIEHRVLLINTGSLHVYTADERLLA